MRATQHREHRRPFRSVLDGGKAKGGSQPAVSAAAVSTARTAVDFVSDGDAIIVGAGDAGEQLARRLLAHTGLVVVTNSLVVAGILATTSAQVIVTAGTLRGDTRGLVGTATVNSLRHLHVGRAFVGGDGFSPLRGLTHQQESSASVARAMTGAAGEVVVLIDRERWGFDAPYVGVRPESVVAVLVSERASGIGAASSRVDSTQLRTIRGGAPDA